MWRWRETMSKDYWGHERRKKEEEEDKKRIKTNLDIENEENELKKKIYDILEECGIQLKIEGCGCCDSPEVTFIYKGETIVNEEGCFNFSNVGEREYENYHKKEAERENI